MSFPAFRFRAASGSACGFPSGSSQTCPLGCNRNDGWPVGRTGRYHRALYGCTGSSEVCLELKKNLATAAACRSGTKWGCRVSGVGSGGAIRLSGDRVTRDRASRCCTRRPIFVVALPIMSPSDGCLLNRGSQASQGIIRALETPTVSLPSPMPCRPGRRLEKLLLRHFKPSRRQLEACLGQV